MFFIFRDRIRTVSPDDVKRVAGTYLKQSNRTLGIFVPTEKPDSAEIPFVKDADIAAMVKDYKGDAMVAQGEAFDPSPANIEARVEAREDRRHRRAFLPKENRGDSVVANHRASIRRRKVADEPRKCRLNLPDSSSSGARRSTPVSRFKDEFDRLKAQVNVFGGATAANVSIETTRQNLPAVLRLVGEILREPSFPQSEFDQLKQETLTQIEGQKSEPTSVAITELSRHLQYLPKGPSAVCRNDRRNDRRSDGRNTR